MVFITLGPDLEMGLADVDRQHQSMFDAVNSLHEALRSGTGVEEVVRLLRFLRQYSDEHFASEEALMEEKGFPGLDRHRILHQQLTTRVADLEARLSRGSEKIAMDVLILIRAWLTQHIRAEDRRFLEFLRHASE